MALALWFAGLLGLVAATIVASARARAMPNDVVGRRPIAAAALACAALAAAAVWVWGGALASDARTARLRDGALVHVALAGIRVPLAAPLSIGHAPADALRLAGDGPTLARVEPGASPAAARGPGTASSTSNTDPIVRGDRLAPVRADEDAARVAAHRGCTAERAAYAVPRGAAVVAIECSGDLPVRAIAIRAERANEIVVEPIALRGAREHITVRAGDALRLGGAADAIPGLTTWDLPSPGGAAALIAVPLDPTECASWAPDPSTSARARDGGCDVESGPFVLRATPLVPDANAVTARGLATAVAIGAPPFALFVALVLARRRDRRTRGFARAMRLGLLGAGLAALCDWRLAWAYRIDILRDLAAHGARLVDNQLAVAAIGAALAGNAVLAHDAVAESSLARRLALGTLAWAGWLAAALAFAGPAHALTAAPSRAQLGVAVLSLVAALLPALAVLAARAARRFGPGLALAAIAAGAIGAKAIAPRGTLLKLGLAYAFVLAAHGALRVGLAASTSLRDRVAGAALIGIALLALGRYDAGVTLAIAGVGLAVAMLVAGHDAAFDARDSARIGVLEREHARLLSVHGLAGVALAVGVAAVALAAGDRALIERGAGVAVHLPLAAAGLFALAAIVARSHRRAWVPWLLAAVAAVGAWSARGELVERATGGSSVGSRRIAAVLEPGYALLRDEHAFAENASAWREAALPRMAAPSAWSGEGYFGARVRDIGVARSIDNDYLPVLVARETGAGGIAQTVALLLLLVASGGVIASVRLRHASRAHRARWLITAVVGALCVYQPLASLGVLPLTGISWPGLGIDSPADIWLFVMGAVWCLLGDVDDAGALDDERIRKTARLRRARAVAAAALGVAALAGILVVARAGACALRRVATDDARIDEALRYADALACPWDSRDGASVADVVPDSLASDPRDEDTARFDRELRAGWARDRPALVRGLGSCAGAPGAWKLAKEGSTCLATLRAGMPRVELRVERLGAPATGATKPAAPSGVSGPASGVSGSASGVSGGDAATDAGEDDASGPADAAGAYRATCRVQIADAVIASLRAPPPVARAPRIRVVSAAMGVAATDVGEILVGQRVIRLRPGAAAIAIADAKTGSVPASRVAIGGDATLEVRTNPRAVVLRGDAELFVAEAGADGEPGGWRRTAHGPEVVLERVSLIAAGPRAHRVVALFRPPRAWPGAAPTVDALLADDTSSVGARSRRAYPYGAALPELGWVNPFDAQRSLGLDGWIHAALERTTGNGGAPTGRSNTSGASMASAPTAPNTCGLLEPPAAPREQICSTSPLDGVTECRVALQPELAATLRALAADVLAKPEAHTGKPTTPVRAAYVVLRGDTGELLAQGNLVPGRPDLAYAPTDAAAEAELVALREQRGESDRERAEWNLPIAVGSTFKPIVARAAEEAFPAELSLLQLTAAGHGTGCKSHRGASVDTMLGHCPPAPLAGNPSTADVHEFLAHSPNWYQAALGVLGLGLGGTGPSAATFTVKGEPVTLSDIAASDLASWPATEPLQISDAQGGIVTGHTVELDGLRRTPLWRRIEALLGRPLCTLGDRARCEAAAERADTCAARGLPIAKPGRDLRYLVALGPDRVDVYGDARAKSGTAPRSVPIREYFQLLRGSGVHAVGSLAQLTDAFGRVVYDPSPGAPRLAASWFPAPAAGTLPTWSCAKPSTGHAATVVGADGGLCAVVQEGGTARAHVAALLDGPRVVIYGAKTGTIDSLADIARRPAACRAWNDRHVASAQLACGRTTPDDSLFVIAFGVVTAKGTIPITLGIQLQRGGKGTAAHVAPSFVRAIADYLR